LIEVKKIFTDDVKQAILKRKKEVNKTFIIVSKLMGLYGMSEYTIIAENLILAKEVSDQFFEEHISVDFIKGDMLLDETALCVYKSILTGYIDVKQYMVFLDYVESLENARRLNNHAIQFYRNKSFMELFKTMYTESKHKATFPDEVKIINIWCILELLSRTLLPKIYYFIKGLPIMFKIKFITHSISNRLKAEIQQ